MAILEDCCQKPPTIHQDACCTYRLPGDEVLGDDAGHLAHALRVGLLSDLFDQRCKEFVLHIPEKLVSLPTGAMCQIVAQI